jgi:uncharacterized protein YggE
MHPAIERKKWRPAMAALRLIAAFAVCVISLGGLTVAAGAQDQKSPPPARIVVTGEGSVRAAPDYALITGGVTVRAKTAQEAAAANARLMVNVMAALRDAGIAHEDIQTSHYSIAPVYAPPQQNAEPKLTGFSATNQVSAKVKDIAKVGDVIDRLIAAGATDIGGVQFLHADISKVLDGARQAAVADARRKAQLYAEAAGIRLGSVIWITEEPAYTPPYPMAALRAAPAAPTPIAVGEDTLRAQITVGFDIAP